MLRTNLASVILQMAASDLGDITTFPFLDAPDVSQIKDGIRLLAELGALSEEDAPKRPRLTAIGRQLAAVPVDPRMARMLLAAERQGCLGEMLIIVSGLSIQDPRERPADHRDKADALHARFFFARADRAEEPAASSLARTIERRDSARLVGQADAPDPPDARTGSSAHDASDFLALLRLWEYLREAQKSLSGNGFRRLCRDEFLHFLRIREWQDLHGQLKQICRELGLHRNDVAASPERVHTAALTGLLSHVGLADVRNEPKHPVGRRGRPVLREYLGARGTRFAINPGSGLARIQPPLIVAAEITETTRLWARTVAAITASQIEEVAQHLLNRQYSEPHWSARSGSVFAYETVSLYGVPVIAGRQVPYAKINPVAAREIFIRSALVEGQWRTRHRFFTHNADIRAEAEAMEDRTRRRDLVVDDQTIFDFYDARIPAEIVSAAHFNSWWRHTDEEQRDRLSMTLDDLLVGSAGVDHAAFPSTWQVGDHSLLVSYLFEPGHERDGVSVTIPVGTLNQIPAAPFSWQVPGFRAELATELIRTLPKPLRKTFAPAPDVARRALDWLSKHPGSHAESLPDALARALRALTGEAVGSEDWRLDQVPGHYRVTFVVCSAGADKEELALGKDLADLQTRLHSRVQNALDTAATNIIRSGARTWDFGRIAGQVELPSTGQRVVGYPALVDEGSSVGLTICQTPERQLATHTFGLRRLVFLNTPDPTRWVVAHLSNADKLALGTGPYPSVSDLLEDGRLASVGELIRRDESGPVRDPESFSALCDRVRVDNADLMQRITRLAAEISDRNGTVLEALPRVRRRSEAAAADIAEQVGNLVFSGFLGATPYEHLTELPRYLKAAQVRIETLLSSATTRDAAGFAVINRVEDAYADLCEQTPPGRLPSFVEEVGWLIEELRVSLFAQALRTRVTVSEKRVLAAIDGARSQLRNQTAR